MGLLPGLFYTLFFIAFIYYAVRIGEIYLFSRAVGWHTYLMIFLFTLLCPLLYSSFSIGAIAYIWRSILNDVPIEWIFPVLYIACGYIFMIQPFAKYYDIRKMTLYTVGVSCFWLVVGIVIILLNPVWNDQLERNLHTSFPSIGLFLALTNLFVLVTISLYFRYRFIENQRRPLEGEEYHAEVK